MTSEAGSSHSRHSSHRRQRSRSASPRRSSSRYSKEDERYISSSSSSRHDPQLHRENRDREYEYYRDRRRLRDVDKDRESRRHRDEDRYRDRDRKRTSARDERRSKSPSVRKRQRDEDDKISTKERKRDLYDSPKSSSRRDGSLERSNYRHSKGKEDEDTSASNDPLARLSTSSHTTTNAVQGVASDPSSFAPTTESRIDGPNNAPAYTKDDLLPQGAVPLTVTAIIAETEEETKLRERQEKLAAWKASKAKQASAASAQMGDIRNPPGPLADNSVRSKINTSMTSRLAVPAKHRSNALSVMDNDDEKERQGQAMFRPTEGESQVEQGNIHAKDVAVDDDESSDDELVRDNATGVVEGKEKIELTVEADDKPKSNGGSTMPASRITRAQSVNIDSEDELETYMASITDEVQKVNAADQARGLFVPRMNSKLGMDDSKEPGDVEEEQEENAAAREEAELEGTSLRAEDILALAAKKIKKKDLLAVDHTKMEYEAFRKAFYTPPQDIANMTEEEAVDLRLQLDGIKIRGLGCPKPITKWSHCGLPAVCLEVIKILAYESPTPIQAQAIPAIMSGRDVIGVAKTGSGKTIAFLLPLFRHIKDQRPPAPHEGPIAMIMTPTRELAGQIHRECKPFLKALGLRAAVSYGGSPLKDNIADIKRGAEIVVCTPGRMIELLTTNSGKVVNLRRVTYLVLDEADRMFDMGFEPQVMKIIGQIRPDRQTVLFSATFPKQMESLARKILSRPLELTVGGRSKVAPEIQQVVEVRQEETKFNRLLEVLGQYSNADQDMRSLIFVDRQESADNLMRELIKKGYICQSLHGGKDQVDRDQVIADFKSGSIPVVIATSVAARGLDVKQLKLVVNFDCPNHMEDYVHRAGRTGRAGNTGTCMTFITPEQERYSVDLVRALKASDATIPAEAQRMHDHYLASLKKEGKSYSHGGFGGKGLDKLEQERSDAEKSQRAAYGEAPAQQESSTLFDEEGELKPEVSLPGMDVEIKRGRAPESRGPSIVAPAAQGSSDAVSRAHQVALSLSNSIRSRAPHLFMHDDRGMGTSNSVSDPNATDFHATVPINDFPQRVRWRVTNKETMSSLTEATGASVTNKGIFYAKGAEPGLDGAPKLHLLIESNEEDKVRLAVNAIKRILVEASIEALDQEARDPGRIGRYVV